MTRAAGGSTCDMDTENTHSSIIGNRSADGRRFKRPLVGSPTLAANMPKSDPDFAQVGCFRNSPRDGSWGASGSVSMSSSNVYRINAEDCLRMAAAAKDERNKPFWLTLAQSWLRLAEHSARSSPESRVERPRVGWGRP